MAKGVPNKNCTPGFQKLVAEIERGEKPGYRETAKRSGARRKRAHDGEQIYFITLTKRHIHCLIFDYPSFIERKKIISMKSEY